MSPDNAPERDALDLDSRSILPAEWLALRERHPRAGWQADSRLGMTAQFWLERHDAFRRLAAALQQMTGRFRGGGLDPEDFSAGFAPRLQLLLSELNGHHQVEDFHYFPLFRRAEPRLVPGFALLDRDHKTLHLSLVETAEAANALLQALARAPAEAEGPAETYAEVSGLLLTRMARHLDDEEDLVIPLLIERGEDGLMP
ncbi:MAG: hemerythrin domain-containing protein [Kiloniellaceae bacterium]